ncbi:MAG: hypothetical protein ABR499_18860 [Gemmatimonadaceae bacterium]
MNTAPTTSARARHAPVRSGDQDGGDGLRRLAHAPQSVALLSRRAPQPPHRLYTRTPLDETSR